jgi:hypothetical protein
MAHGTLNDAAITVSALLTRSSAVSFTEYATNKGVTQDKPRSHPLIVCQRMSLPYAHQHLILDAATIL